MANRNWSRPIDFFARRTNYIDHMMPIYFALDESMRGSFYVPALILPHATSKGLNAVPLKARGVNNKIDVAPPGDGPLVTCAYGDLQLAVRKNPKRPQIFMQHGVGLTFPNSGYAGGGGVQRNVSLFLDPNERTRHRIARRFPNIPGAVIGMPKMDKWPPSASPLSPIFEEHENRGRKAEAGGVYFVPLGWEGDCSGGGECPGALSASVE